MDGPLPINLNEVWELYFETIDTCSEVGDDIYHLIFNDPILFPLQRRREMMYMMKKARSIDPKIVYEIGADKGGGLYHWCKCLPSVERVIACEIRGTPYSHLFEKAFPHIDFLWLPWSSYHKRVVKTVGRWLKGDRIDCLFIDGDKTQFHTDFYVYKPMMNSPSIVFMHDVKDETPGNSYRRVAESLPKAHIHIDISESIQAMESAEKEIRSTCPHEDWLRYWKGQSCGLGVIEL